MARNETQRIGWLSRNSLDRHRPLLLMMEGCLLFIGCVFWIYMSLVDNSFTADMWGEFAYSIPAKLWAFSNMAAAAMTIIGLLKPIKSGMVISGSAFHCLQFAALAYSTVFTGGAVVIGLYASVFFLPLNMWLLFEAYGRDRP